MFLLFACTGGSEPTLPDPGALEAGLAHARIPAPVGIGTAGYGGFGADLPDSDSPFAEIYPATKNLHGHPEIQVVVISRGAPYEAVFVRVDAVGVFQQLRRAIVLQVEEQSGRDIDDSLLIGATHTHSGPGRVIDGGGLFDLIADRFFPEYYERLLDTIVDTILGAYDDLAPARIGTGVVECATAHSDRRCEDGLDYTNDAIPLVAVEREGAIDALVMAYAVHGTGLDIDQLTLSQDVSGAIEEAVEDGFEDPVEVLMFNSWGADMAPANPAEVATQTGASMPEGFEKMDRAGAAVASAVHAGLAELDWEEEPDIRLSTHRLRIDRESIGYETEEFPFDYGGVYCGGEEDCDPATEVDGLDQACIPFPEEFPAPDQTVMTVGVLGGHHVVTFPGEPGTLLAEDVMDAIEAETEAVGSLMFLGYTQDYLGYSVLEDDWWQGGYEASGALWGPRQGEYLADCAVDIFAAWAAGAPAGFREPDPVEPFTDPQYTAYEVESALEIGSVVTEVDGSYGVEEIVVFAVNGSDPWLGAPLATVIDEGGAPVSRSNSAVLDSDGYGAWVELSVDPTYEDEDEASARAFTWTFNFPVQRPTPGTAALEAGRYRVSVVIPTADGESTVQSAEFVVSR
ncbi:MAG TPA: neutral/alkaline non-lysosomal ceramidase N-terminal domain-containing protein [Myxococcota bacterium]|nr:neutral/alkaline non-lysosomal ceramidase N-terminal domain-containing protein [Myxococcota bacterium]